MNSLILKSPEFNKLSGELKEKIIKQPVNTKLLSETDYFNNMYEIKYPYTKLPTEFNGRKQWKFLNYTIQEQGTCGSCWAFACTSMLQDRYTILTKGRINTTLSPTRLLLCDVAGIDIEFGLKASTDTELNIAIQAEEQLTKSKYGTCYGSTLLNGLAYLYTFGTCTDRCLPYKYQYIYEAIQKKSPIYSNVPHNTEQQITPPNTAANYLDRISYLDYLTQKTQLFFENKIDIDEINQANMLSYNLREFNSIEKSPLCLDIMGSTADMCVNSSADSVSTGEQLGTPARFYRLGIYYAIQGKDTADTVEKIKQDIYKWGPVITGIELYPDFYDYDFSKVYVWNKKGPKIGGHAIEIVGWGTQDGIDYWEIKNSWGNKWGDDGFFKIRMGTNECKIEENVVAGIPDFFSYGIGSDISKKYGIEIYSNSKTTIRKPNTKIIPTDFISEGDLFTGLMRQSLDYGFFQITPAEQEARKLQPTYSYIHGWIGGIDPLTGFSRRSMLMNIGLDYTSPVNIDNIDFKKYAGKLSTSYFYDIVPSSINDYIFYVMIVLFCIMVGCLLIHKFVIRRNRDLSKS